MDDLINMNSNSTSVNDDYINQIAIEDLNGNSIILKDDSLVFENHTSITNTSHLENRYNRHL